MTYKIIEQRIPIRDLWPAMRNIDGVIVRGNEQLYVDRDKDELVVVKRVLIPGMKA